MLPEELCSYQNCRRHQSIEANTPKFPLNYYRALWLGNKRPTFLINQIQMCQWRVSSMVEWLNSNPEVLGSNLCHSSAMKHKEMKHYAV